MKTPLAAALRMMIQYEGGGQVDTAGASGKSEVGAIKFWQRPLPEQMVLDVRDVPVPHLLYYINENHPVVALTGDGSARVILGYDSSTVTVYDPFGNQTYTMSQDEATQSFAAFGNRFFQLRAP